MAKLYKNERGWWVRTDSEFSVFESKESALSFCSATGMDVEEIVCELPIKHPKKKKTKKKAEESE